jgi:hypothetical protein
MDVKANELLCICLFPSYAYKPYDHKAGSKFDNNSEESAESLVLHVKGLALIEKPSSIRRRLILGLTKRVFASLEDVEEIDHFEQRAKHFFSRPLQSNSIKV